jgi:hypothetical protein
MLVLLYVCHPFLYTQMEGRRGGLLLRASSEHIPIVRAARARPGYLVVPPLPLPLPRLPCKTGDNRRQLRRLDRLGHVHLKAGR